MSFSGLFKPLVQWVSEYVPIIDALSMTYVCKNWKVISINEKQRIIAELCRVFPPNVNRAIPDGKTFAEALTKTGAVISGGFLLRCIFGFPKSWGNGDIDMFIKQHEWCHDDEIRLPRDRDCRYQFRFLLEWNSSKTEEKLRSELKNFDADHDEFRRANFTTRILERFRFKFANIDLDYIIVHRNFRGDVNCFIRRTFDIDICANTFDGETLRMLNPRALVERQFTCITKSHGYDDNEHWPCNMECKISGCLTCGNPSQCYPELTGKCTCSSQAKNESNLDWLKTKSAERITKYKSRGFTCAKSGIELGKRSDWVFE